jgi:predicted nucleic acid-binding protein
MSGEPATYVLDSFALLALLGGEQGKARVKEILTECEQGEAQAFFSLINLGEVLYLIEREQGELKAHLALAAIDSLPVTLVPATRETVLAAAHIKARHRLSYADAYAVTAALQHQAILVTGDPEFKAVEKLVTVDWL